MATNDYDGRIVIDTELDTKGFYVSSKEVEKRLKSIASEINKFGAGLQKNAAGYTDAISEILSRQYPNTVEGWMDKLRDLGEVRVPTDAYRQLSAETEKAGQKLEALLNRQEKLKDLGVKERSSQWKTLQYDLDQASQRYDALAAAKARMEQDGTAYATGQQSAAYRKLAMELGELHESAARSAAELERVKNPMPNLATNLFAKATRGVRNFAGSLKDATLQSNALVKTLTSMKRLLLTRIKRMFISAIFSSVKESLRSLAQFSDAFNGAMSNVKNSAKQLSGNIAVALGGLLQTAAPAIATIINLLSQAITYLNAFLALLGGKTTMIVAKKQTDSYRDSLKGATGAAKELKKEIYGFDELNRRSDNSGGGGSSAGDLFEEVPIDSILPTNIKNLFNELKTLWENGQYFDFGYTLGKNLNTFLQTGDDWINNTLRPKGKEWGHNIAEVFNGAIVGTDWSLAGTLLIDGFTAILDTVGAFFGTLDYGGITAAISGFLAGAMAATARWLQGKDWVDVGNGLYDGLKRAIERIEYDDLADAFFGLLGTAFGAAVGSIGGFFQSTWEEVKAYFERKVREAGGNIPKALLLGILDGFNLIGKIESWIKEHIADPFVDGVIKTFGLDSENGEVQKVGGLIASGMVDGIVKNIPWLKDMVWIKDVFGSLITLVERIFRIGSPSKVMEDIGKNIDAGLLQGVNTSWPTTKSTIVNLWNGLRSTLNASDWSSVGSNLVAGLRNGIANNWNSLKTTVGILADSLTKRVCTKFQVSSPSKAWAEIGKFLDLGLIEGIEDHKRAVLESVSSMAQDVTGQIEGEGATLPVDAEGDKLINTLSGITAKLSDLATIFRDINSVLLSMGGLLTPAIAAGLDVPYRTRIGTDSSSITEFSNGLDERLSDLVYLLRQIFDLLDRKPLGVDDDELAAAIAFALRGEARGFGGV